MVHRRRWLACLTALGMGTALLAPSGAAHAQALSPSSKVALLSLVGDEMHVVIYRGQTSSRMDNNARHSYAVPDPVFDHAAMASAARAIQRVAPGTQVSEVSVPTAGSETDPAALLPEGRLLSDSNVFTALKGGGFTHLLLIGKHRDEARMRFQHGTVGSGAVRGLGFYIDTGLRTRRSETGEVAQGYIAPYAYLMLTLVDLNGPRIMATQAVTESLAQSAARNPEGNNPWGALSAEEKVRLLRLMVQRGVDGGVERLLAPR